MSACLRIQAAAIARASEETNALRLRGTFFQSRKRHSIAEVCSWMGERIFRCAFQMSFDSFWRLHSVLLPHILTMTERATIYKKKEEDKVAIFPFPPFVTEKLLQACGLVPHCIISLADHHMTSCVAVFCISYSEVLKSVWVVVDAINHCPQFHISYPSSLEEQCRIAAECYSASIPKFRSCDGAIDGILILTEKPSLTEAKSVGVDQKNSYAVASTSLV